ncbi:MAG TPA: DUF4136 domain-containing protein [Lunatimonas sp.]|nr:DUF4136 domain-containing protein [Lunatimonas sp.]
MTEVSPSYSLGNYSSFAFYETSAAGELSEKYQQHLDFLKSEISKHMAYRGLLPAQNGNADLLINIGILVEKKTQTRETGLLTDPGTFNYIGQRRYSWKSETLEVGQYRKGSVDIHLIDAKNNEAVWAGVTTGVIDENEDRLLKTISKGVSEMFEKL